MFYDKMTLDSDILSPSARLEIIKKRKAETQKMQDLKNNAKQRKYLLTMSDSLKGLFEYHLNENRPVDGSIIVPRPNELQLIKEEERNVFIECLFCLTCRDSELVAKNDIEEQLVAHEKQILHDYRSAGYRIIRGKYSYYIIVNRK